MAVTKPKPVYLWLATDESRHSFLGKKFPRRMSDGQRGWRHYWRHDAETICIGMNALGQTWADPAWKIEIRRIK